MEILCPRRCRHRARFVRHHAGLPRRPARTRPGHAVHELRRPFTCTPAKLDGALLTLAFIFLLFGYGTKAALVPLHGWLPDAYAQGPAPLTTSLSGLMLNVALIAILRFRHLMQANFAAGGGAMPPGPFLLTLGLASLALTAFSFGRRRDARRFFGFSSMEHSGIAVFAFGIGGAAAIFGGLLHMLLHTLHQIGPVPGAHPRRRPARRRFPRKLRLFAPARHAAQQQASRLAARAFPSSR